MNFIIGQMIGIAALAISIVTVQFKNVRHILAGEIASNLSIALSFVFLGGLSGAWICIAAAIQTGIIYYMKRHNVCENIGKMMILPFAIVYIAGTVVVYRGWEDIVSCICAMLYLAAILQKDTAKYRCFMAGNSLLWIVYDLFTCAYVNIITHGMLLISLIIAMIRLDKRPKVRNGRI